MFACITGWAAIEGQTVGTVLKITVIVILLVLVVFSALADMPFIQARWHMETWLGGLDRMIYIRLVSLAGLVIACFYAWGYKRKVEASQKYRRSKEVIAAAETAAAAKRQTMVRLEETLKADYAAKEQALRKDIERKSQDYDQRLQALREQNLQLKEAVGKLMAKLKNNKGA